VGVVESDSESVSVVVETDVEVAGPGVEIGTPDPEVMVTGNSLAVSVKASDQSSSPILMEQVATAVPTSQARVYGL
jgi:phage gp45-like